MKCNINTKSREEGMEVLNRNRLLPCIQYIVNHVLGRLVKTPTKRWPVKWKQHHCWSFHDWLSTTWWLRWLRVDKLARFYRIGPIVMFIKCKLGNYWLIIRNTFNFCFSYKLPLIHRMVSSRNLIPDHFENSASLCYSALHELLLLAPPSLVARWKG